MESKIQPYVGPRSFEQKDQAIFYGRDKEASDLLSLVIANNVILVYSPSGAGKTSLLNAKLIPQLGAEGLEVYPLARVRSMNNAQIIESEKITNIFVFNTLMNWSEASKIEKYNVGQLEEMSFANFLGECGYKKDKYNLPLPRVLIFDQFEEIFTWHIERWKDRVGFFEQIEKALELDPLLRIVFVMREDHIAKLDPYIRLVPDMLRTRFHIDRLRKDAALMAIKKPLEATERSFEVGVAEKLVDDLLKIRVETQPGDTILADGEFVETIQVQVVCQSLWQQLQENDTQITMNHIKKFGDIDNALSNFYDITIHSVRAYVDEEPLRRWFKELLITPMETRGTVCRAPQSTGGIPNSAIDILEDKHLIRAEWRSGARWYELTHDRFVRPIISSNEKYFSTVTGMQEKDEGEARAKKIIINAEQAWSVNNYGDALRLYNEALSIYKDVGDSWGGKNILVSMGQICSESGDYRKAEYNYLKAIEIDPNYAAVHFNYAILLQKLGKTNMAEVYYIKAIELDPKDAEAHAAYGLLLVDHGKRDNALSETESASELFKETGCITQSYLAKALFYEKYSEKYFNQKEYRKSSDDLNIASDEYFKAAETVDGDLIDILTLQGNVLKAKSSVRKISQKSWYNIVFKGLGVNRDIPEFVHNLQNAAIWYQKASVCEVDGKKDVCSACHLSISVFSEVLGAMSAFISGNNTEITKDEWLNSLESARKIYTDKELNGGMALVESLRQLVKCVDELAEQKAIGLKIQEERLEKCYNNLTNVNDNLGGVLGLISDHATEAIRDYAKKEGMVGFVDELNPNKSFFDNRSVKVAIWIIGAIVTIILAIIADQLFEWRIQDRVVEWLLNM